jgi:hypothetical protein
MFENTRKILSLVSLPYTHTPSFVQTILTSTSLKLLTNQNFNAPMLSDNFSPFTAFAG